MCSVRVRSRLRSAGVCVRLRGVRAVRACVRAVLCVRACVRGRTRSAMNSALGKCIMMGIDLEFFFLEVRRWTQIPIRIQSMFANETDDEG